MSKGTKKESRMFMCKGKKNHTLISSFERVAKLPTSSPIAYLETFTILTPLGGSSGILASAKECHRPLSLTISPEPPPSETVHSEL